MARFALALAILAMPSSACLVVGSPALDDPEQTAPFFIPSTASPDAREILTISNEQVLSKDKITFSAEFASEDLGTPVRARYFLDYGVENAAGQPYDDYESVQQIPPGSLSDTPRRKAVANVPVVKLKPGCHTLTLMLSHAFDDESGCPVHLADSTQLTWMFVVCDSVGCDLSNCPTSSANPASASCPTTTLVGGGAQ